MPRAAEASASSSSSCRCIRGVEAERVEAGIEGRTEVGVGREVTGVAGRRRRRRRVGRVDAQVRSS